MIGWVFALYLMVPLAGTGPFHFKPDGQLGPYPTKQVCESARQAVYVLDNPSEHYFLEECRKEARGEGARARAAGPEGERADRADEAGT